jgi:hypothetical protein
MVVRNTCFVSLFEVWTYSEVYVEGILSRQFGVIKKHCCYCGFYLINKFNLDRFVQCGVSGLVSEV